MVSLSGAAAEAMLVGEATCDGVDCDRVDRLVAKHGLTEHKLERLWRRTCTLLDRHRDSVQRVAEALLARKMLTGRQIDALIEGEV
jgi:hypothetical protein